ncbi:MAG: oxidoreductase [Gammaproteobacteria bacterium SG8_11]|nr:MAG: oxidoreductase [Gammaproteobacteria bacterium SG8_11]
MLAAEYILVLLIVLPLTAAVVAFLWPRYAAPVALVSAAAMLLLSANLALLITATEPIRYNLGGWQAPLGIALYADGLAVLMVSMTAIVGIAVAAYARAYFQPGDSATGSRVALFWPLWLLLTAGLNALFLSIDAFNIYVTLELVGLSAVALVAIAQKPEALRAAMRYLLVSLLGSLAYMLGVALLYAQYATLDLEMLHLSMNATPATWTALVLMSSGLMLKAALFPLHFWLPPAHSSAPAPVSALLSALVVKAAFYLVLRLWLHVFEEIVTVNAAQLMGMLGAGAILWGSLQALRAERFKLLVAYSTVAQIGYLFLAIPLAQTEGASLAAASAAVYLALSHAFAKAAMFTTAGTVLHVAGHDRIRDMAGISQSYPLTAFTMGLAGMALIGLPPSGGFMGKWLMLNAAFVSGQWWWVVVLLVGSLLAAAYVFRVISHAFTHLEQIPYQIKLDWKLEWPGLLLALLAALLSILALPLFDALNISTVLSGTPLTESKP